MHYKIQAEMDSVLATLKTTTDDEEIRALLQRLRELLLRADNLVSRTSKDRKKR